MPHPIPGVLPTSSTSSSAQPNKQAVLFASLRQEILVGGYEPGHQLSERAIAKQFNVSRVPVREALIHLERVGLVSITPGLGAHVRIFTSENMRSLYESREALEGMACRLTASRIGGGVLEELRDECLRLQADDGPLDRRQCADLGKRFHSTIVTSSRNAVLIEMINTITDRVVLCRRLSFDRSPDRLVRQSIDEHLRIIEAVHQGDADAAEDEMRKHVAVWREHSLAMLIGDSQNPASQPTRHDHGDPDYG